MSKKMTRQQMLKIMELQFKCQQLRAEMSEATVPYLEELKKTLGPDLSSSTGNYGPFINQVSTAAGHCLSMIAAMDETLPRHLQGFKMSLGLDKAAAMKRLQFKRHMLK